MRITDVLISRRTQSYIQGAMQRLARTQEMMSTTRKVLRLSDDPPGLSQLLNVRSSMAMSEQYTRNINDGLSYLDAADTALGTAGEILQKALGYAVQGANGIPPEDMAAIGEQIDKMVDEMVDIANTTVGGKYIFAGTDNSRPPFSRDSSQEIDKQIVYQGNLERVSREILDQASYNIDVPAVIKNTTPVPTAGVFGYVNGDPDPATDVTGGVFEALINLKQHLENGDAEDVNTSIGELNDQHDHLLRYRVQIGARTNHFEAVRDQLGDQEVRMTQVMDNLEGADIARVSIDLARQQLSYQASLAAGAQILQTSLLQFLR